MIISHTGRIDAKELELDCTSCDILVAHHIHKANLGLLEYISTLISTKLKLITNSEKLAEHFVDYVIDRSRIHSKRHQPVWRSTA